MTQVATDALRSLGDLVPNYGLAALRGRALRVILLLESEAEFGLLAPRQPSLIEDKRVTDCTTRNDPWAQNLSTTPVASKSK